jgi:hypothetical protein
MIDRRRFDQARTRRGGQQQQSEAVRTARYGDSDLAPRRRQSVEIGREARDELRVGTGNRRGSCERTSP